MYTVLPIKHGVCIQLKANRKILNLTNVKDTILHVLQLQAYLISYKLNLRRHFDSSDLKIEKNFKKSKKNILF